MAFETHTRVLGLRSSDILHAQWRPQFYERRGYVRPPLRGGRRCADAGTSTFSAAASAVAAATATAAATTTAATAATAAASAAATAASADDDNAPFAYTPAHLVVLDHQERSVVLVVRGSLELADVLADLQAAPATPTMALPTSAALTMAPPTVVIPT